MTHEEAKALREKLDATTYGEDVVIPRYQLAVLLEYYDTAYRQMGIGPNGWVKPRA